jgi:hypothetical protein
MCHSDGYTNTPTDCVGCHLDDFNATTDPDHELAGFPTDCTQCHDEGAWTPSSFDHENIWPLNGAHATISGECLSCHSDGFTNTPTDCVGCHLDDFNATADPDHELAGFPTDCTQCHDEGAWTPSSFDHNNIWPLNGAHALISGECLMCHSDGYTNTPTDCVGCHLDDFNATTDPDHQSAMFPTDCIQCHDEGAWIPSTFDHDAMYFPIYSGKHREEWNTCMDCHFDTGNYALFSCIDCHEHNNQSEVDNDHSEVNGYQYESNACLMCHPNGEN